MRDIQCYAKAPSSLQPKTLGVLSNKIPDSVFNINQKFIDTLHLVPCCQRIANTGSIRRVPMENHLRLAKPMQQRA